MQLNRLLLAPLALLAIIVFFSSSSQGSSIQQLLRVSSWRSRTLAPLYEPSPSPTTFPHFGQDHAPRYIIVFKQGQPSELIEQHCDAIATLIRRDVRPAEFIAVDHQLTPFKIGSFEGYMGALSPPLLHQVRDSPPVAYVERDSVVTAAGQPEVGVEDVQLGAPWGLARISHREPLGFTTHDRYEFDPRGGHGISVYVLDTGINLHHVELGGRARWGKTIPRNSADYDGNGHGSHLAGTVASARFGVAKRASVVVKVLGDNGAGLLSDVIQGIAWAVEDALKLQEVLDGGSGGPAVALLAVGGGKSRALDDVVNAAVDEGVSVVVGAGGDNSDACSFSPAGAEKAITASASTISDFRAPFANVGNCVDVFAPGVNVLSILNTGTNSTMSLSGTSPAAAHTAGIAAYFLSVDLNATSVPSSEVFNDQQPEQPVGGRVASLGAQVKQLVFGAGPRGRPFPRTSVTTSKHAGGSQLSPAQLKHLIKQLATEWALSDIPAGTPNLLLFNNYTIKA